MTAKFLRTLIVTHLVGKLMIIKYGSAPSLVLNIIYLMVLSRYCK